MEPNEAYVSLGNQLLKLLKSLSPDQAEALARGSARLAFVPSGSRVVESSPAIDLALKAVQRLSDDEVGRLGQPGSVTLALVPPGGRVVDASPAVDLALKAVQKLTFEEIDKLRQPGSALKPVFKGGRVVYPVNISQIVTEVSSLGTEDEIIKFLDADDRLKPADLKKVAKELGIDLPASAKDRIIIGAHIAKSLTAYGIR